MSSLKPFLLLVFVIPFILCGQKLDYDMQDGVNVSRYTGVDDQIYPIPGKTPLFTVDLNGTRHASANTMDKLVRIEIKEDHEFNRGWKVGITFINISPDTVILENVVPFGASPDRVHITGLGPWSLSRAYLFLPERSPVNVILPDDAWEMGYGAMEMTGGVSVASIARRKEVDKGKKYRYKTYLYPGGKVDYHLYADEYSGTWQDGLVKMFRDRWLFSLESFDDSLYMREDLQWIRHEYVIGLQMAWDHKFYDPLRGEYTIDEFLGEGERHFGGYDVFGIWPTWPRLGLDERNQWDLFADLPGGLPGQREIAGLLQQNDKKYFICYNPWDQSTRKENPYQGMASLIDATNADGVVLDTRGASSYELQRAADSIKPGVVMYSEGMAVVSDMPGIVSGRVHNAIFMSPPLNLNKLIRPDFAIYRVWDVQQAPLHREAAIAFFNGYGTELNFFAPGRPEYLEKEMKFLGETSMILRENSPNFLSFDWVPLLATGEDSVLVNYWPTHDKSIYTVLNLSPKGFHGPLIPLVDKEWHYVSLYHHEELLPDTIDGIIYAPVQTTPFQDQWTGKRKEGSIDCVAGFPSRLSARIKNYILSYEAENGDHILIWAGNPSYHNERFLKVDELKGEIDLNSMFHGFEGKMVVQLKDESEYLLDERILYLEPGQPRKISQISFTEPAGGRSKGEMIFIEGGPYLFYAESGDNFIPYPDAGDTLEVSMGDFYIDKYPVTNAEYKRFIKSSGYVPDDTSNYLKHWQEGSYPADLADHPVVYISYDDARAYAAWAGKRLPTEVEWQYAAQGQRLSAFPWGDEPDPSKHNNSLGHTTSVHRYPGGASPYGVMDMVGNVWQITSDLYDNGSYYFVMLKGGSFYEPTSSWWYVSGGVKPVSWRQMWLQVSSGFDRSSTVGFRCVKDPPDRK